MKLEEKIIWWKSSWMFNLALDNFGFLAICDLSTPQHPSICVCKVQLISKCLFGVIVLTKKDNEFFSRISALASKKWLNKKLYYTNYVKQPLVSIINCLYFFDLTSFKRLVQKSLKKSIDVWSKRWHQKDIWN